MVIENPVNSGKLLTSDKLEDNPEPSEITFVILTVQRLSRKGVHSKRSGSAGHLILSDDDIVSSIQKCIAEVNSSD